MKPPKDHFKKFIFWLCARHRNRAGALGDAARRLGPAHTLDDCARADLELLFAEAFRINEFGFYLSTMRMQGAAIRLDEMLEERGEPGSASMPPPWKRADDEGVA